MSGSTLVRFADGRNPALEVTLSVADYLLVVRALHALVRSADADPVVEEARALCTRLAAEFDAMANGRITLEAALSEDGALIERELAVLAEHDPEAFWWLTTHRLPVLSAPSRPSRLSVLTAALLAYARRDPRAVELLQELGRAVDLPAVEAAAERLRAAHVPTAIERELRAIAGDLAPGGGDLYWNEDTRTAVWCAHDRDPFGPVRPQLAALERELAAVPGVEHVRIAGAAAPSPDAADGGDPSWVRLTRTPAERGA